MTDVFRTDLDPDPSRAEGTGMVEVAETVLATLQDSERRFRASMEHSPIGMALTAMDGTWLDVNPALCKLLGYTKTELMEAGFKKVTHKDDRDATVGIARQMVATHQKSVSLEKRYIHASGDIITGLLNLTVVRDDKDAPTMYISQIMDITAARRLDYLKGEFITTVNHELRTPLTAIKGALSLLEAFSAEALSERDQQLVAVASRNVSRLNSLLDDVLEMETLSSDIFDPVVEDVNVQDIIENVIHAVEPRATVAKVMIQKGTFNADLIFQTDSGKIDRVIKILVSNAVKFSNAGGAILIETESLNGAVCISVTNQGRPIPEKMRAFIFEPFVQAEPTSTRRKEGAGLGLAIAKHLIDHLGGDLGYSSTEDATRFWVKLPITYRNV